MSDNDVNVSFKASVEGALAGVNKLTKAVEAFGDVGHSIIGTFTALGEAVAVAFAVEKIQQFVESVTDLGVQIERTSQQLGISTEMVGEYNAAAKFSDTSLEGMRNGMARFDLQIQEATKGTGNAAAAFDVLGIKVRDNQGHIKDAQALMAEVSEVFAQTADNGNKTAIAMALFGRQGKDLIPILDQGAAGMEEMRAIAERTGTLFSKDLVDAMHQTHDKTVELDLAEQGLKNTLFLGIKPAFDLVEGGMINLIEGFNDLIKSTDLWIEKLDNLIIKLREFLHLHNDITESNQGGDGLMHDPDDKNKPTIKPLGDSIDRNALNKKKLEADIAFYNTQQQLYKEDYDHWMQIENLKLAEIAHNYTKHSKEYQEELGKKIAMEQNHALQSTKIWTTLFDGMARAGEKTINGLISGTLKWHDAFRSTLANMVVSLEQTWMTAIEAAIKRQVQQWLMGELLKTEATEVGNAARTASDTAANTTSMASTFMKYIHTIAADAAATYANVFAFMSPALGPFAAVPAAGAAALVGGMAALIPSFDVGTSYVPQTGLALIHEGERIVTAKDNASGNYGGGGTQGMQVHFNAPVYGFRDFQTAVSQAVSQSMRNFNPALMAKMK